MPATSRPPTRAAVYGRTGSCLGRNGTLVAFLLDALNVVTGNLDVEGGGRVRRLADRLRATSPIALGVATTARAARGSADFPDVLGALPATLMAKEITTPGKGQIRALFVSAGNPVLSVPNGDELEAAMGELDLMVSIDFYVNDTAKHADYVLPATTFLEREDFPLPFLGLFTTPFIQMTEAVVEPCGRGASGVGDHRGDLGANRSRALERRADATGRARRARSSRRSGWSSSLLRIGPKGDLFGLRRGGLNLKKLRENPHGIVLAEDREGGVLRRKIRTDDKRVHLAPPEIVAEAERLATANRARSATSRCG